MQVFLDFVIVTLQITPVDDITIRITYYYYYYYYYY